MSGVGLLRNPASTMNRRRRVLVPPAGMPVAEPAAPGATEEAVAGLLARGVRVVAVDGGDGTVRLVLDALARLGAFERAAVLLLPRGDTGLFWREIGGAPRGAGMTGFLAAAGGMAAVRRRLLRVEAGGEERRGMILGFGAYERATRLAAGRAEGRGTLRVAAALAGALVRAAAEGPEGPWRRGVALSVARDGEALEGDRFLFAATAAEGAVLPGLDPFRGAEGEGGLRWLDIAAPGRWLLAAAPFVLAGRRREWMARAGYAAGRARELAVAGAGSFVLDGDVLPAGGTVRIGTCDRARFVVPAGRAGR